jgi:hypothetical protein
MQIESLISRGVVLRSTLVAVLRAVGFFRNETIWADEKPGYFIPLHLSMLGERQRYIYDLSLITRNARN